MANFIYNNASDAFELTVSSIGLGSSIGIFGSTWNAASSLSDPTAALSAINDALDEITDLEFSGIQITSTRNDEGIAMAFGATDVVYKGTRYMNLSEATELRTSVINKINTDPTVSGSLSYQDVVISSSHRT